MTPPLHVSITGLELKRIWHAPRFWRHAMASMAQARAADGCHAADSRTIKGVHHTLSVWSSRQAMLAYMRSGAHLDAMKAFRSIATGKTYGFEADHIPDWSDVHRLWHEHGRDV